MSICPYDEMPISFFHKKMLKQLGISGRVIHCSAQVFIYRFGSKRVVVLENRRPLNFYVLLAGSAVVIKSDENGNTNPAWFMKRGDVFGVWNCIF